MKFDTLVWGPAAYPLCCCTPRCGGIVPRVATLWLWSVVTGLVIQPRGTGVVVTVHGHHNVANLARRAASVGGFP